MTSSTCLSSHDDSKLNTGFATILAMNDADFALLGRFGLSHCLFHLLHIHGLLLLCRVGAPAETGIGSHRDGYPVKQAGQHCF